MTVLPFTLDQLEVLETIARVGSFVEAARQLHRATSAVSYAVRTLEGVLGIKLFDRSGRRAVLTPAGELTLEAVREVLLRSRHLENLSHQLQEEWEPHLHVVVDGVLPLAPVMRAVARFTALDVPTKLLMSREHLSGVRKRWERERAQVMLTVDGSGDALTIAIPLAPIEMVLVAHRSHPIHGEPGPVPRSSLHRFFEIIVADSGDRDASPPNHLACVGSPHLVEVPDFPSKLAALVGMIGFGFLPLHLARPHIDTGELARVWMDEGSSYTLTPHAMVRRHAPVGPATRRFLDGLRNEACKEEVPTTDPASALPAPSRVAARRSGRAGARPKRRR